MPTRPPSPCTQPGCGQLAYANGRCADHPRKPWSQRRTDTGRHGATRRDRRMRTRVLREEPHCRRCGAPSEQDDHIVPLAEGGARHARANHQGLCTTCHQQKTAQEAARGRRRAGR